MAPFGPSIKDIWLTRGEGDLGKPDIYCYHSNVFFARMNSYIEIKGGSEY